MMTPTIARAPLLGLLIAILLATPTRGTEPGEAARKIASDVALAAQFDTLYRLTEELVFWQGVAIMGAQNAWEFDYSGADGNAWPWTLRLYNALDETEVEAVRAAQAIARSRTADSEDRAAGEALYSGHLEVRDSSEAVHAHLSAGRTDAAARVYEKKTLGLRRTIAGLSYSAAASIRQRIDRAALDLRLGR